MFNKTKFSLGFIGAALFSQVACTEHQISGSIIKHKLNDSKVLVDIVKDGKREVYGWYITHLYNQECIGDCTREIFYDTRKTPIYFNTKSIEYNDNGLSYAFNFDSSSVLSYECKTIESCDSFVLTFSGRYSTPDQ
ncbi:hypothetical protein BB559_002152 [Furculomyces boomerangus]|uniref:AA1-like domain-containing protein n=2 Tax=Harpellales TaxID=61421 RepID=A0A2T9YXP7_9FUNG|nr:hypothetical protein BB559_002152 [Furculomyces boomerangus]PVZ99906.1 hypothetical protein BB558_004058 [Smittium angustum]